MAQFMEEAFIEARKAMAAGEVPVGCVFVYKNQIIARGCNGVNATKNATRHAEFVCIDQIMNFCEQNDLKWQNVFDEITVVVTVEPCIMCAAGLYELGAKEIIYGCANDRFGGKTVVDVEKFFGKTIKITAGIRANEAMDLLKEFYKGENPSAPVQKIKG